MNLIVKLLGHNLLHLLCVNLDHILDLLILKIIKDYLLENVHYMIDNQKFKLNLIILMYKIQKDQEQ